MKYKFINEDALVKVPIAIMPDIVLALGSVGKKSTFGSTLLPLLKHGG